MDFGQNLLAQPVTPDSINKISGRRVVVLFIVRPHGKVPSVAALPEIRRLGLGELRVEQLRPRGAVHVGAGGDFLGP